MKLIALALMLALALGTAQGYPLSGGNGAVNCTLFGTEKRALTSEEGGNNITDLVLTIDVGLTGAANANYALVDSKDHIYQEDVSRSVELQPGRKLVRFMVPRDALFKLLRVAPSEGDAFSINYWKTPKAINGDIILRYYGIADSYIGTDNISQAFELGIANNGTDSVPLSPENFTLFDQNGWEYYTLYGFSPVVLEAGKATKVWVYFNDMSPWSKPALLVYDFLGSHPIVVDLDRDTGPLSDEQVYGSSGKQTPAAVEGAVKAPSADQKAASQKVAPKEISNQEVASQESGSEEQAETSAPEVADMKETASAVQSISKPVVPGTIANGPDALKAQLESVKARVTGGQSSTTGVSSSESINGTVESAKDRLAKVREKLKGI